MIAPLHKAFRPLIHAFWRLQRGMVLGVRVVVMDSSGRVALVRHSYEEGWHFPGGGLERGETAAAAARREAREEAGCDPDRLALFAVYNNEARVPGDHVLLYRAAGYSLCDPRGGMEIAERGWFALDTAMEIASPATRRRLTELFEGAAPDPYW